MKHFTDSDVKNADAEFPRISTIDYRSELSDSPLWWHEKGLTQTASGYGGKLTTRWKISFNGKLYRVYATCFSNAASHWFTAKGRKIFID